MKKLYFHLFILLTFLFQTLVAQDLKARVYPNPSILSSSGFEREGSKNLTFSVGSSSSVIVLKHEGIDARQGKAQESILPSSKELDETTGIVLYPNPFIDRITLNIENFDNAENYHFKLFDLSGNLLNTSFVSHNREEILLNSNAKAMYVLILYKNQKEIKSFKLMPANL